MSHAVLLMLHHHTTNSFKNTRWWYLVCSYQSHGALVHEPKQEQIWRCSTALTSFTLSASTICHKFNHWVLCAYEVECRKMHGLLYASWAELDWSQLKNAKTSKILHLLAYSTTTHTHGEIAQLQFWSWADITLTQWTIKKGHFIFDYNFS